MSPPPRLRYIPRTVDGTGDDTRRRRLGYALIALAVLLFAAELVFIALGRLDVAGVIFLAFVAGWFVLRSYQRRTGRTG